MKPAKIKLPAYLRSEPPPAAAIAAMRCSACSAMLVQSSRHWFACPKSLAHSRLVHVSQLAVAIANAWELLGKRKLTARFTVLRLRQAAANQR